MPLFKLNFAGESLSTATLAPAAKTNLNLETHLESWLENSPEALAEGAFLWIGRQASAPVQEKTIFPDLLGLDADGNVVIVELKKGRCPRDVVAQILEYAAWAKELTDEQIKELASTYFASSSSHSGKPLEEVFQEIFETDLQVLNRSLRLFIAAEEIPPSIARVCRFLRTSHALDVTCVAITVHQTAAGEYLVNTEYIVGQEAAQPPKVNTSTRWSGDKPVKQVVWEAVQEITGPDKTRIFSPKEVVEEILKQYPTFNKSTVGCQIIAGCVNHTSRKHYPGGDDRYWWLDKGKYRLYDPDKDKISEP